MNSSKIKEVRVKSADWTDTIEVDAEIFDDYLLEAATRAVENRKNDPNFNISAVIQTWESKRDKDPDALQVYNSYIVMVNAGLHKKAEHVRAEFKRKNNIDLKLQKLTGDKINGPRKSKASGSSAGE